MKAVLAAFNQEKALVGAFSVIVQLHRLIVWLSSSLAARAPRTLPRAVPTIIEYKFIYKMEVALDA